jgi:drug/metabolite transporter (DMT)-like permease
MYVKIICKYSFGWENMKTLKQNLSAVLAAFIWGSAFIAQEMCSGYLGAFSITALRSIVAVIVLAVMVTILNKTGKSTVKAKN